MAEPIIVVKENPGTLRVEIYDQNGVEIDSLTCPSIPFRASDSEVEIDGTKYKAKKSEKFGDCVEIRIRTPGGKSAQAS